MSKRQRDVVNCIFSRRFPRRRRAGTLRREAGDTLVEVLISLVVLSLAVVALLGGLLSSTSASATHRNIANLDSILQSLAESARYQVQTQPEDGTEGPLFQPCPASMSLYPIVSDPYPDAAAPNTPIAVFVTGFAPGSAVVVTVGATVVTPSTGNTVPANGTPIVFPAPSASGRVTVSAGGLSGASVTPFTSEAAGSPSPGMAGSELANYELSSSVGSFNGDCTHQQLITLSLTDPEAGNAADASLHFVVGNFAPQPVVISAVSSSATVPATVTFTAYVTDNHGNPVQTGTITWTFLSCTGSCWDAGSPKSNVTPPTCPSTGVTCSTFAGGTATLTLQLAYGQQGTYVVQATYHNLVPGGYLDGTSAKSAVQVKEAVPTFTLTEATSSGGQPPPGSGYLVFTLTATGNTATGTNDPNWVGYGQPPPDNIWSIIGSDGSAPACSTYAGPSTSFPSSSATYTCYLSNPPSSSIPINYTVSANYPGSSNYYAAAVTQLSVTVPQVTLSYVSTASNGTVTLQATVSGVAGGVPPSAVPTISVNPAPSNNPAPGCTGPTSVSGATAYYTCTFKGSSGRSYSVTATYPGYPTDPNYTAGETASPLQVTA
jgi:type II secretory pathway pseudopilin PulG